MPVKKGKCHMFRNTVVGSTLRVRKAVPAFAARGRRTPSGRSLREINRLFWNPASIFSFPLQQAGLPDSGLLAAYGSITPRPHSRARFSYKVTPMPTSDVVGPCHSVPGKCHMFSDGKFRTSPAAVLAPPPALGFL